MASLDAGNPPNAAMAVAGSTEAVPGKIGSYTIGTFASDGPWLPARILGRLTVSVGTKVAVRFLDGTSIADWSARYAAAPDEQAVVKHTLTDGGLVDGTLEVLAPPPGDWAVELELDYPTGQGAGSYYWRVTVRP